MPSPPPKKESSPRPVSAARVAAKNEFRPPIIKGEDGLFWTIFLLLFLLVMPASIYLLRVPLPPEEPEQAAIERYASLLLQQKPPKVQEKAKQGTGAEEAKEAEEKEKEKEEKGKKKDEGTSQGEAGKEAGRKISREELRKRVSTKGLLGLITARTGSRGGAIADILRSGGIGESLDKALQGVSGLEVAHRAEELMGTRGGGGGGRGGAVDIGKLKAVEGGSIALGAKKTAKVPEVTLQGPQAISGVFDANSLRQVVERARPLVKFCYEEQLKRDPTLQGKIVVRFVIGEDGTVTSVEIASSTFNNKDFEGCLIRVVRRFRFPKPQGGSVTVEYPFVLSPASG